MKKAETTTNADEGIGKIVSTIWKKLGVFLVGFTNEMQENNLENQVLFRFFPPFISSQTKVT